MWSLGKFPVYPAPQLWLNQSSIIPCLVKCLELFLDVSLLEFKEEIWFSYCRIREKKESVTVLLCGTSGCGKSTLSALLVVVFCYYK